MRHRTMAAAAAAAAVTVGGVVAGTSATTLAQFSATAKGADSRAGAATVALGAGGGSVALGYPDLKPGDRRVVQLTISYQGNVPADISLEIAPSGSAALCVQREGRWKSRPGGAVTVAVGTSVPVSYCELLNGLALPLASAVPPRSERKIDVAVMLSRDANDGLRGLAEKDVATVRASGGFTDEAVGTISVDTAGPDSDNNGGGRRIGDDTDQKPDTNSAAAPQSSPQSPSLTSQESSARPPVVLPVECARAGMRLEDFEDVIVLGPDQHTWNALEQRGQGAGPFLVVGTDADDEIVGSAGADCIVGGGGRDKLTGGAGNDVLIGGEGADQLDGGPGDDWLFGGSGVDDLRGGAGIDRFDGGPDGASCDAGHDAAGATDCQALAPPASSTTVGEGTNRSGADTTSPPPASPPTTAPPTTVPPPTARPMPAPRTTASPTPAASPPPTTTVTPATSASSAPQTPPTSPTEAPSGGTASSPAPHGAGEDPSAARPAASAPPRLASGP